MKNIKKRIIVSTLFGILFLASISFASDVEPYATFSSSFAGSVTSSWTYVTGSSVKCTYPGVANVNWKTSSQSASHNLWFRVVNSNVESRGSRLFSYLEHGNINTSTSNGYNYKLQARRENSVDPSTYVSGSWNC